MGPGLPPPSAVFFGELAGETSEALAAYGPFDEAAVAALDPLVVLFTAAWGALAPFVGEPIGPRTQRRLDWLRERYADPRSGTPPR